MSKVIKFKKLVEGSIVPSKPKEGDVGYDLHLFGVAKTTKQMGKYQLSPEYHYIIKTGIACELPEGCWGLLKPRSGLSVHSGMSVLAGVVDNNYRGEICVIVTVKETIFLEEGDRIAQMVIMPEIIADVEVIDELSDSNRGAKGFGSSGK